MVFTIENKSMSGLERFSMWTWNYDDQNLRQLPLNLKGDKLSVTFDGKWVLFTNTLRTYRAVELWAYNIHDDRLLQLFQPQPYNQHENGTYETVRKPILHDGIAYYTVLWLLESGESWTDIYATELETNTTRRITTLPEIQINFMDADGERIAYTNDKDAWVLDLNSPDEPLRLPKTQGDNNGPQLSEDWVFYASADGWDSDLIAYNLETNEMKVIVEGDEEFMPGFDSIHGNRVYIVAQIVNPFEGGPYRAMRVFWMDSSRLP